MKKHTIYITAIFIAFLTACSTVPLTGRKQFNLANSEQIQQESGIAYQSLLKDPKTKVIVTGADAQMVKNVGNKIANAIDTYLKQNGYANQYNFKWEFHLIQSPDINAWCMPGGKVAIYTGILPITKNEAGLATVMGHEIAHAIAKHTEERYTQTLGAQALGGVIGAYAGSDAINQLYGLGGQLALLKYGRNQESEADRLGLIFMAMAGYDPQSAVAFWQRMQTAKQANGATPEFLSTHPSDATRIAAIEKRLPEAYKYYKK